jgi:Prokaryotic E2 family E
MSLPLPDQHYLAERQIAHVVQADQGMVCVTFPGWRLPPGLNVAQADVLVRLAPGYPDVAPDMWWVSPEIRRADGTVVPGTEVREHHLGREWQRWSRHFQPGQWQSGIDGLESYLALVRAEFATAAGQGRAA